MKINEAFEFFGLTTNTNFSDVKKRYKELVKKYHPDVEGGSDEDFKKLQQAYELLLAYFEYIKTIDVKNQVVDSLEVERLRTIKQRIYKKKQEKELKIATAILHFKSSAFYTASRIIAVFSIIVSLVCLYDAIVPGTIVYEPLQGVKLPKNVEELYGNTEVYVQDRIVTTDIVTAQIISLHRYVLIENSALFNRVKSVLISNGIENTEVETINVYNESVYFIVLLLALSIRVFIIHKNTIEFVIFSKYYSVYFLIGLNLFVLFGDNRLLYLLKIF